MTPRLTKPAPQVRLATGFERRFPPLRKLAAEVSRIAGSTSDPIARVELLDLAPHVARMERVLDEIVQNALEELRMAAQEARQ